MVEDYPAALATFILVFFTTTGCNLIRSFTRHVLKDDPVWYSYAAEFISTFQLVAGAMEGDIILEEYGLLSYGFYLWVLFISQGITFDGDSTANSCLTWHSMLMHDCGTLSGISKICFQVLGGQMAYPYVRYLWKVVPTSRHRLKVSYSLTTYCTSALSVTVLEGCFAEALATLTYVLLLSFKPYSRYTGIVTDATLQVIIITTGLEWTGMMFNPALAAAITLNCRNHPLLEHVMVYWIAPLAAVPLARVLTSSVRATVKRPKQD